ncbi:unnamed protein product [Peronospora farinosa]|uniref:Uncharacterized protein n=1 Tax=Peronospora farinosa TaxID=134698 RepID=A0ABN8C3M6_9STRA|nr:unnamed protein product [Peronospora farinosa]
MRLDSLFFVALLFACFNTSSTRSISTSMGSVTPSQKDVPTHEGSYSSTRTIASGYATNAIMPGSGI